MRAFFQTFISLLALCVVPSQQIARCLLNREDYLICKYQNNRLVRAENNQYSIHYTRLRQSTSGYLECNVRAKEQLVTNITDLGTQEMRIMYSPGFIKGENYTNQLRIEYLVQCKSDEMALFNMTDLNIQGPENCQDDMGNNRCQDYVQIIRGSFGTTDVCGKTPTTNAVLSLEFGDFTVVFRTSEEVTGVGFQLYSICYRPAERDLPNCFEATEFTSGVCNASNVGSGGNASSVGSGEPPTPRSKRAAKDDNFIDESDDIATSYASLFAGYPSHLKMAADLAKFHHQWNRMRRAAKVKPITENILYNQTVNYTDDTIFIFGPDGVKVDMHKGVKVLQTFDSDGVIEHYVGKVKEDRNPHFFGPGPLKILGRHAFFQLFVIDPRGVVPEPEEQEELLAMNTELLNRVPVENDPVLIDPEPGRGDLSQIPGITRRQATNIAQQNETDREAILAALRNVEACNPVLRAQSRATLSFFRRINATFVDELTTFNMSCSLSNNNTQLMCDSDSVTLPGRTMCRVDNFMPSPCDPFVIEGVTLSPVPSTSVNVTAVNCLGQRAEVILQVPVPL